MAISQLVLHHFRNLACAELELSPHYNLLYGLNGAGKTTVLEAVHYLILGRSFRTHLLSRMVQSHHREFTLFGQLQHTTGLISIGVTRSLDQGKQLKIDGRVVRSTLEIAQTLPLQLLNHDSYQLLAGGPKVRRQFLDRGLFHVKHGYLELWQTVERLLKQRNMALRERARSDYIQMWDVELSRVGESLHALRQDYVATFVPVANAMLARLRAGFTITLNYTAGWGQGDLLTALQRSLRQDLQVSYTTVGPHRADLQILLQGVSAKDALSRGQQKLVVYALQLAQAELLQQTRKLSSVYLIDDLFAELDQPSSQKLLAVLFEQREAQVFFTGLERESLQGVFSEQLERTQCFELAQGVVSPCELHKS